jgi:hypothetical protein
MPRPQAAARSKRGGTSEHGQHSVWLLEIGRLKARSEISPRPTSRWRPSSELGRQVSPQRAGAGDPQRGLDEPAIVRDQTAAIAVLAGQNSRDPRPPDRPATRVEASVMIRHSRSDRSVLIFDPYVERVKFELVTSGEKVKLTETLDPRRRGSGAFGTMLARSGYEALPFLLVPTSDVPSECTDGSPEDAVHNRSRRVLVAATGQQSANDEPRRAQRTSGKAEDPARGACMLAGAGV